MDKITFTEEQLKKLGYRNKRKKLNFDADTRYAIFGHVAAEDESPERLKEYYLKTDIYNSMRSKLPLLLLVGHKGVGKSALLKVLQFEDREQNKIFISIQPNDIIGIDKNFTNFLEQIENWKNGVAKVIFSKLIISMNTYITTPVHNQNIKAWFEKFSELILSTLGKKLSDMQTEHIDLSPAQFTSIFKNALFKEKPVTVYIDDLDRGWENSRNDIKNLSAMINAIRDLSRDTINLRFRIALRSDVYYAFRISSDETADKIDSSVLWQKWTNHEILVMLIKRIETYFGESINEDYLLNAQQAEIGSYLNIVFEERFQGKGQWSNAPIHRVLMSLIRKRPRDLVKLCTISAENAYQKHHDHILTSDLENSFSRYSQDRLADTCMEYQSEFSQINELLLKMKPTQKEMITGNPCLFTRAELLKKLKDILSMSRFSFKDGREVTPNSLAAFLFKINFLTARKNSDGIIQRLYYEENQYIYNDFSDFGYSYEIHPAYRWVLQPSKIDDIFKQLELID